MKPEKVPSGLREGAELALARFERTVKRLARAQIAGRPATVKKKHSRAFTPHKNAKRRTIMIDRVPAPLHEAINGKAKREGVSIRALVLTYLAEWSAS
jgi:predicted HicB family RNase H-like nuclease